MRCTPASDHHHPRRHHQRSDCVRRPTKSAGGRDNHQGQNCAGVSWAPSLHHALLLLLTCAGTVAQAEFARIQTGVLREGSQLEKGPTTVFTEQDNQGCFRQGTALGDPKALEIQTRQDAADCQATLHIQPTDVHPTITGAISIFFKLPPSSTQLLRK